MRYRLAALLVSVAAALGFALSAVPAGASVVSGAVANSAGVAGAYMVPNANRLANGDHVTGVRTTFTLTTAMEYGSPSNSPNLGVELCRYQSITTPGAAAVLYATYAGGGIFDIWAQHSTSSNCLAALGGTTGTPQLIDTVPVGHSLYLAITVSPNHIITYVDSDQSTLTGGRTTFGGFTFGFDRSGVGTNADTALLTTPATNPLASFTLSSTRDQGGWATVNRANLTRMNTLRVEDTTDGTTTGGVLLVPSISGASTVNLAMGQLSN